jgi:hypothetical protein
LNPDIDVVGSNVIYFSTSITSPVGQSNFPLHNRLIVNRYRSGYHGLVHGSIMIKSKILKQFKYDQQRVPAEEYDLFSRILSSGLKASNLREALTYVRIHSGSVSNDYPMSTFKLICALQKLYWNINISSFEFYRKYLMIYCYRKSLTESNLRKFYYLLIASLLSPDLILKRLKRK